MESQLLSGDDFITKVVDITRFHISWKATLKNFLWLQEIIKEDEILRHLK